MAQFYEVEQSENTRGAGLVRLIKRLFLTTVCTAVTGAVANFLYERFFAPDLYAAGHPLFRGAFLIVFTSIFILAGLVCLGLPLSYLLNRLNAENYASYAIVGAVAGVAFGFALFRLSHVEFLAINTLYGAVSALLWWHFKRDSQPHI